MIRLIACDACARHVRVDEPRCPFCGTARSPSPATAPLTLTRMSRSAAFAFAASLATSGCRTPPWDALDSPPVEPDAAEVADLATLPDFVVPLSDASGVDAVDLAQQPIYGAPPPTRSDGEE